MAQGGFKKTTKPAAAKVAHSKKQASRIQKSSNTNKKTSAGIEKAHRKFTSGMAAQTEALLGERAGHLELIGKGKKGSKKATVKGGSKKFG